MSPDNSPEIIGLDDQNENIDRPYAHHCAGNRFAAMSPRSDEHTICERVF
jgi:hypothetical protein